MKKKTKHYSGKKLTGIAIICIGMIVLPLILIVNLDFLLKTEDGIATSGKIREAQYVLYIGIKDKDTHKPMLSKQDSIAAAVDILKGYFGNYDIFDMETWEQVGGYIIRDYALVIPLRDTDIDTIHKAADKLIAKFHQRSAQIHFNQKEWQVYTPENMEKVIVFI